MPNYKNIFFIKEGAKKVDFDIEKMFLEDIAPDHMSFNSDELKGFIDEKLIKPEEVSKERYDELLEYIKELEGRISKIEEQNFEYVLNSGQSELGIDSSEFEDLLSANKANSYPKNLLDSRDDFRKKSIDVPSVSIKQEELDALLADIDDELNNDFENNVEEYGIYTENEKTDITEPSLETTLDEFNNNDLEGVNLKEEKFSYPNEDVMGLLENSFTSNKDFDYSIEKGISLEDFSDLGNDLKIETENDIEDVNESEIHDLSNNLEDIKESLSEDVPNVFPQSKVEDSQEKENLLETLGNNILDSDSKLVIDEVNNDLDFLKQNFNEDPELDNDSANLDSGKLFGYENLEAEGISGLEVSETEVINGAKSSDPDENTEYSVNDDEILDSSSQVENPSLSIEGKDFDDFETVLKQDLNYLNMNDTLDNFDHKNLYDDDIKQLEDKINEGEEIELKPLIGMLKNDDSFEKKGSSLGKTLKVDDFKFSDIEQILNRFEDEDYLSKVNLSSEEKIFLAKFIERIEDELSHNSESSSFKSKPEYEILNKIKYLLIKK